MAWIESHQALRTHRKTIAMRAALKVPRCHVIGLLHCLWWWALDNAPDGDLSTLDAAVIAEGADWDGDPEAFVSALKRAGFLDQPGTLHDWSEYAGRLISEREDARERLKRYRAMKKERTNAERTPNVQGTYTERTGLPNPTQPVIERENARVGVRACAGPRDYSVDPPTIQEVTAAASTVGLPQVEVQKCFDHFTAQGWRRKNGMPVASLPSLLATWKTEYESKRSIGASTGRVNRNLGTANDGNPADYSGIG